MCISFVTGVGNFQPFYEKVDLIVCEFFVREVFMCFLLACKSSWSCFLSLV